MRVAEKDGTVIFAVKVVPRASKTEIVGVMEDALKIRLAAPPVDGAANAELIKFLSKVFDVSKSRIAILSGETGKIKQIKITDFNRENFERHLASEKRA